MRSPRRLAFVALVAVPVAFLALAAARSPDPAGKLEESMQLLQADVKKLEKAFEKKEKDLAGALPIVLEMQKAVQDAKTETPPKANDIKDAKKKDEFVHGFRVELIKLQKALLDLESAAVEGKDADAAKIFNNQVKALKSEGHSKYKGE